MKEENKYLKSSYEGIKISHIILTTIVLLIAIIAMIKLGIISIPSFPEIYYESSHFSNLFSEIRTKMVVMPAIFGLLVVVYLVRKNK
jgi:4-hydroxyphenylpyruvate dioxygenase-like putative hemolysin